MYKFAIEKVLVAYGIRYRQILEPEKGYRNEIWPVVTEDGCTINVTFFKREPDIVDRIRRADAVSEFLSASALTTRKRIDHRILSFRVGDQLAYIGVYTYLPGKTIPWEAYTMKHIKTLGATMSGMHTLLSDMPSIELPSVYSEYQEILARMNKYFVRSGVKSSMNKKLGLTIVGHRFELYSGLLQKYKTIPGQQPLHMDFVRGNILFVGTEITGILDFEKTALGHPIMDIARTLAFLLVDCKYKESGKVYKYFLKSGYIKRGNGHNVGDDNDLNVFVELFLLYDFYKFLVHNPYESLHENEHYIRTKDILARCGVVLLKQ